MPYSSIVFDHTMRELLCYLQPSRCLDIGAGAGKYGEFLREVAPGCHSVAIEIEPDYIKEFNLPNIYSEVRCCDAMSLLETDVEQSYDLVVIGDTIEHLRKSDGVDLIHFLAYRSRAIILLYPERYLQNSVRGYKSEAHISSWCPADFVWFAHSQICEDGIQRLVVLQGFLAEEDLLPAVNEILLSRQP